MFKSRQCCAPHRDSTKYWKECDYSVAYVNMLGPRSLPEVFVWVGPGYETETEAL